MTPHEDWLRSYEIRAFEQLKDRVTELEKELVNTRNGLRVIGGIVSNAGGPVARAVEKIALATLDGKEIDL